MIQYGGNLREGGNAGGRFEPFVGPGYTLNIPEQENNLPDQELRIGAAGAKRTILRWYLLIRH
jgi:hypothetical protein